MNLRRWITGVVLLALMAAAAAALEWTRNPAASAAATNAASVRAAPENGARSRREWLVDTRPVLTARRMALLASTPEEQEFAHRAVRIADHAVDLAFADAIRDAADNPPDPTPETRQLAGAKQKAQASIDADRRRIEQITTQLSASRGGESARLEDQLEVAKAQLELDQDELNDATENLERAGGDPQARIRRLKAVYEAAQQQPAQTPALEAARPNLEASSLSARLRAWMAQKEKLAQLGQAQREALDKGQRLSSRRETLAQRVAQETERREAAKRSAAGLAEGKGEGGAPSKEAATTALTSLKRFAETQRRLSDIGRRIQDEQDLGEVYADWIAVVETHARAALHRVLQGVIWILAILFVVFLGVRLVEHLFDGIEREKLRMGTLREVVKLAVRLVGALVILLIVLGVPSQLTTILGLAGAGLTVALKDFILAFFGWFVLMGRNGIRVGDWVEIKGVGGEVAEIGLLHTVLLETGSWTDAGHPTGRRVSFVNSFAIEGHYFNFSTSGQWMWDEIRVLIPLGQDPYPIIDGIQKLVERETEANAKLAEQEWRSTTTRYRVRTFSAVPGINVVPTSTGVEINVRYITRAYERHETRRKLYHAVVELMHRKRPDKGADAA